ncbi:hypothetical protein QM042_02195 [Escherichia coli]|uniref:hypothetical protein n=1 Tax=Escherichia coli TaxID=562 RepID=UPI003987D381
MYGLFKVCIPAHKTNKTNGFSERLIIADGIPDFWRDSVSVNYRKEDPISIISTMSRPTAQREFNGIDRVTGMLSVNHSIIGCQTGDWMNVDGNLMRVKMFKNGNVQLEIHSHIS